jgi:hypothetical protein
LTTIAARIPQFITSARKPVAVSVRPREAEGAIPTHPSKGCYVRVMRYINIVIAKDDYEVEIVSKVISFNQVSSGSAKTIYLFIYFFVCTF